jgi:hypothetical protein
MKAIGLLAALFILAAGSVYLISAQETKIQWFGHAAFSITTPKGKVLLIDPWLANPLNPEAKNGKDALAAVPKVEDDCLSGKADGEKIRRQLTILSGKAQREQAF